MDGNTIPINENTAIIVKSSGDLYLRGLEQTEVRFRGGEDRIRVQHSNDTLYLETRSNMDIEVPRSAKVIVEKVGGSAFVQDIAGELVIQKVGGDLSLQWVGMLRIEKVGGDCTIDGAGEALSIEKVGGDLIVRQASGTVRVETVGGNCDVQTAGGDILDARAGGDVLAYITEEVQEKVTLRAGGNVDIFIPSNANGRFNLNSNGENISLDLNRQEGAQAQLVEARHYEFSLGEGGPLFETQAGGDVRVSDAAVDPRSITGELERLEKAWADARGRNAGPGWSGGFGFDRTSAWADMVSRRAQEAARRAEQRVQAATRRTEEHIRQAAEREMRRAERFGGFPPNMPFPPEPSAPVSPPAQPVSDKERLMVLQMLQEGKITVEQAEQLLAALEGRFNR